MTLPFPIPVLETERLTLRAPRESDLGAMVAFGASPRSAFVGGPFDRDSAWRILLAGIGHWAVRGYGYWAVDRKEDDAFVGRVGVIFPHGAPEPELAWGLFDGFEGHGYAQEAALAARDHACSAMGLGALASFIEPENTRSIALAKRLGAWFEGVFEEDGKTLQIYRHPRPEAQ